MLIWKRIQFEFNWMIQWNFTRFEMSLWYLESDTKNIRFSSMITHYANVIEYSVNFSVTLDPNRMLWKMRRCKMIKVVNHLKCTWFSQRIWFYHNQIVQRLKRWHLNKYHTIVSAAPTNSSCCDFQVNNFHAQIASNDTFFILVIFN